MFLGRRDGMVKTRGYRVELGEVEAALYAHPAIREAVVLPVPDELLGSRLRAVISAATARPASPARGARPLPAVAAGYMVPDVVEFREALPRTSTGKVDRAGLAREAQPGDPETVDGTASVDEKPKKGAQVETVINDYISQELVQDPALLPLTDETSLLESGILDSLSLLRLVVFLEERFGIMVDDADLLPENFASVDAICAYLRAREPGREQAAHG